MKRMCVGVVLFTLFLTTIPIFGQQSTTKMTSQRLRYEWSFFDGKVAIHQSNGSLKLDYGTRSDYYFNWQTGILRFGLYYKQFGIYARTAQVQGFWHRDDFPSHYLIFEPGVIGVSFVPYFTSSYADEDKEGASGYYSEIKGEANFALKIFAEGAFINEILRFPNEIGHNLPEINRRYPTLLTAGALVAYRYFSVELGYKYQTDDWNEFFQLGLSDDPGGINLTGWYIGANMNVGILALAGRPYKTQPHRPVFRIQTTYGDNPGINEIRGGEESVTTQVTVTNVGDGEAQNVQVCLKSNDSNIRISPECKIINKLKPASKDSRDFYIEADKRIREGNVTITAEVIDGNWRDTREKSLVVVFAHEFKRPRLRFVETIIDDDLEYGTDGNADGQLDPGERVDVQTIIENIGEGAAKNVIISIECNDATFDRVRMERISGRDLEPHQKDTVQYRFTVSKDFDPDLSYPSFTLFATADDCDEPAQASMLATISPPDSLSRYPRKSRLKRPNALGIIVYVNDYGDANLNNATFARYDAEVMSKYFVSTLGLSPDNIEIIRDPTKATFEYYFGTENNPQGWLYDRTSTSADTRDYVDEVFIYYSGHGIVVPSDTTCYFIPSDGDIENLSKRAYPRDLLFRNLAKLQVQRFYTFLETCFSGGADDYNFWEGTSSPGGKYKRNTKPAPHPEPTVKDPTDKEKLMSDTAIGTSVQPTPPENMCYDEDITVFAAAARNETAKWYHSKHHGVFTYALIKGLSGSADLDHNKEITVWELKTFLQSSQSGVPYYAWELGRRQQHPSVHTSHDNLVLVKL